MTNRWVTAINPLNTPDPLARVEVIRPQKRSDARKLHRTASERRANGTRDGEVPRPSSLDADLQLLSARRVPGVAGEHVKTGRPGLARPNQHGVWSTSIGGDDGSAGVVYHGREVRTPQLDRRVAGTYSAPVARTRSTSPTWTTSGEWQIAGNWTSINRHIVSRLRVALARRPLRSIGSDPHLDVFRRGPVLYLRRALGGRPSATVAGIGVESWAGECKVRGD